jgi:hypothetical protein
LVQLFHSRPISLRRYDLVTGTEVNAAGGSSTIAMRKRERRPASLFVATDDLARSPGHPFYRKLNELLAVAEFDC